MDTTAFQEINDTIAAISTPYGVGGIAVVRMSGKNAIRIAEKLIWGEGNDKHLTRSVQFCRIADLDDIVITVYHGPHSFTGEDVVELSCHGSLYIQQELMRRLIDLGVRTAKAGEFTQRAFLNGKMDLSEAEAVADLIAAQSKAETDLALNHLRGGISTEIAMLRAQLLEFTSLVELELDFADHEDLEFADRGRLKTLADEIASRLREMVSSFQTGNAIRHGIPVAIVGDANVGKSTLLNALLGEDRAIVSNIPGTTRDTVEDTLILDGVLFRLIDTAGFRSDTTDQIEQMGIERSCLAMEKAMLVLHVVEASSRHPLGILSEWVGGEKMVLTVCNKVDLLPTIPNSTKDKIYISAKNGDLSQLKQAMLRVAQRCTAQANNSVCISSSRHYEALSRGLNAIQRVQQGLQDELSGELLSMDLHDCLDALGEVTGQITSDEVLGNIFSKFCIGK